MGRRGMITRVALRYVRFRLHIRSGLNSYTYAGNSDTIPRTRDSMKWSSEVIICQIGIWSPYTHFNPSTRSMEILIILGKRSPVQPNHA